MIKRSYFFPSIFLFMLTNIAAVAQKKALKAIEWKKIALLHNTEDTPSIGVAGPINAVLGEFLVVAGGANFPDKKPWEGGKKHYSDEIHILQKKQRTYSWLGGVQNLPEPIAYCGNTSTPRGIVYAGGENDKGLSDRVYLIKLPSAAGKLEFEKLPSLPLPLTNISLTSIGNVVYAAGGDGAILSSARFFRLDLDRENSKWDNLPDLPKALANALLLVQESPAGKSIYLIGGRAKHPSGISELSSDLFIYDPEKQTWTTGAAISDGKNTINFSAGSGVAVRDRYLLILGGDNGEVFHQIETHLQKISAARSEEEKARLTAQKNELVIHHKGFYPGMLVYDTNLDTWRKAGELPFLPRVTTTAAMWNKRIIISSGEVKPGIRSPEIMLGKFK